MPRMGFETTGLGLVTFSACLLLTMASSPTKVWADEDGSYVNYESIVNELKASAEEPVQAAPEELNWADVAVHGGVGLVTSFVHLTSPEGVGGYGLLKGFEANFGFNLFTQSARVETLFRTYAQESINESLTAGVREFEMRLVFLPVLQERMRLRMGAGISARYTSLNSFANGQWNNHSESAPFSNLSVGIERRIAKSVTLGPDLSYCSALTGDTFGAAAWDASLRLNATF